jgi:membrane associated rhomboid family serine protease
MSNQSENNDPEASEHPWVTWILITVNIFAYLGMETQGDWINWGAVSPIYVWSGEVWRLATAIFLHGGILHVALNCWVLLQIGRLLEPLIGPARFLFIFLVSGITSFALSLLINTSIAVGSSGAVFGLVGALLGLVLIAPSNKMDRQILRSLLWFVGINIAIGFLLNLTITSFYIDNVAHIGGLFSGFLLGLAFAADKICQRFLSAFFLVAGFCLLFVSVGLSVKPFFSANYYYEMGLHALWQNKIQESSRLADFLKKMQPYGARSAFLQGRIAARKGQKLISKNYFKQAFASHADLIDLWEIAFRNPYQGSEVSGLFFMDVDSNHILCEEFLHAESGQLQPKMFNECSWLFLMKEHSKESDKQKALRWAKKATRLSKNIAPEILHTLAEAYAQNGKIDEAIITMERILLLKPKNLRFFMDEKQRFEKFLIKTLHEKKQ